MQIFYETRKITMQVSTGTTSADTSNLAAQSVEAESLITEGDSVSGSLLSDLRFILWHQSRGKRTSRKYVLRV